MSTVCLFLSLLATFSISKVQANCDSLGSETINTTKGEIVSPGFPNQIDFNASCTYIFKIGAGIKFTIANISLPDGATILLPGAVFVVGERALQSKEWYTQEPYSSLTYFLKKGSSTVGFKGIRILYEKLPEDDCSKSFFAYDTVATMVGEGVEKTCSYYIEPIRSDNNLLIQLSLKSMDLLDGDWLKVYDATSDVILGDYNKTTSFALSPRATELRLDFHLGAVKFKIGYKLVDKASCYEEYFGRQGIISSRNKPCVIVIRKKYSGYPVFPMKYKLSNLNIGQGDHLTVVRKEPSQPTTVQLTTKNNGDLYFFAEVQETIVELNFTTSVQFELSFEPYDDRSCPYFFETFTAPDEFTAYSRHFAVNETCELHFRNIPKVPGMLLEVTRFVVTPGDHMLLYNSDDNTLLMTYDAAQSMLTSEVLDASDVRVELKPGNETRGARRFAIQYRKIPQGTCFKSFFGHGKVSSPQTDCTYMLRFDEDKEPELKFEDLNIPVGEKLILKQFDVYDKVTVTTTLVNSDSAPLKYFLGKIHEYYELQFNSTVSFNVTFRPFQQFKTYSLTADKGVLYSPRYPLSYSIPKQYGATYYISVSSGLVLLNITEVVLTPLRRFITDGLHIYDGGSNRSPKLLVLTNRSSTEDRVVLSSGKKLTVVLYVGYNTHTPNGVFRFKAEYSNTTLDKIQNCSAFKWSHSHASASSALPGRKIVFKCNDGYIDKNDLYNSRRGVERTCGFGGVWKDGKQLECLRICPKITPPTDSNMKVIQSSYTIREYDISYLSCNYKYDLIGAKEVKCTSHGNYSAPLPTCKKRPEKESDSEFKSWYVGAGIGGVGVILTIVFAVLRVCFGCFVCCDNKQGDVNLEMK